MQEFPDKSGISLITVKNERIAGYNIDAIAHDHV
jgi:hypothetical protein